MRILLSVLLFIYSSLIFSQELRQPVDFQLHVVPDSSKFLCSISYSLPYNALVFVKEQNSYKSAFNINLEIFDSTKIISRELIKNEIEVNDYNLTNSSDSLINGVINFQLPPNKLLIKPFLTLKNTTIEYALKPILVDFKNSLDSLLSTPKTLKLVNNKYVLVNRNNYIPFDGENYSFLLPIELSIDTVLVQLWQKDKMVFQKKINQYTKGSYSTVLDDNKIFVEIDSTNMKFNIYLVEGFTQYLDEGEFIFKVIYNGKNLSYKLKSVWFNKPKSLKNREIALTALGYVFKKSQLEQLQKVEDDKFYESLKSFWDKHFPSKTNYNNLLKEFFSRVDYAIEKFGRVSSKMDLFTDRVIIYLKYGAPHSIKRDYINRDNVNEIWYYENVDKTFIFNDNSGTGNFILVR